VFTATLNADFSVAGTRRDLRLFAAISLAKIGFFPQETARFARRLHIHLQDDS
jgi:hypothetical protein